MHTEFWLKIPEGKGHLEDLGVDEKIILECIIGKRGAKL